MCFYVDADWSASVVDETRPIASKTVICDECRRRILPGERYVSIYMQERETCGNCELGDCGDEDELPEGAEQCPDGECDYGETYDYDRCEQCDCVLQAIEAVELSRGCRRWNARPGLEGLHDAMVEADEDGEYARRAVEMFPSLRGHLWRLTGEPVAVGVRGDPLAEFGEPVG